jgi:hypothetical protein
MSYTFGRKLATRSVDFRECAAPAVGYTAAPQKAQLLLQKVMTVPIDIWL